MTDGLHTKRLHERQDCAQTKLVRAVVEEKDSAELKKILDEIDVLNRTAAALPFSRKRGALLKLIAIGFFIVVAAAIGFAIRTSPGRVTIDAIVTAFDVQSSALGTSAVQLGPLSLAVSGASVNKRPSTNVDAAELAKMTSLTEFAPVTPLARVRISRSSRARCYEFVVLDGAWRGTLSRIEDGISATAELGLPKNSVMSFCAPDGLTLTFFGVTSLSLHRAFADAVPPLFAPSAVSGTVQRERVLGERKISEGERIEVGRVSAGALELRADDRIKLLFAGNAERLCALQGTGVADRCDDDLRPTAADLVRQNPKLTQLLVAIVGIAGFIGTVARFFGWKVPGISMIALTLIALSLWSRPATAQNARPFFLNNLVRLTVRSEDGVRKEGYGLVIGRKGDDIWIITAAHVVFVDDFQPYPAPSISAIIGPPDCPTSAMASDAPYKPGRTDVALLPLRVPLRIANLLPLPGNQPQACPHDLWISGIISSRPVPGEELQFIGHGGRLEINPHSVKWTGVRAAAGPNDSMGVEGLATIEGDSGAPVASARGIVGLYIGGIANAG